MRLLALSLCLGMAGCAQKPPPIETAAAPAFDSMKPTAQEQAYQNAIDQLKPVKKVALSASQHQIIVNSIRGKMVDPSSTKFGAIASGVDETGTTNFCTWVNSKNGYGGYAGAKPHAGKIVGKTTQEFDFYTYGFDIHALCGQLGLDLEDIAKPI